MSLRRCQDWNGEGVTAGVLPLNNTFRMARRQVARLCVLVGASCLYGSAVSAERQMERLSRGVVAVQQDDGSVFVGWRFFAMDAEDLSFNLYRTADGSPAVKVNERPIDGATNYLDSQAESDRDLEYFVRPILEGGEGGASHRARVWDLDYLEISIQSLPGYWPGDASAADLDGDGEYEIVLHQTSRGRDNSFPGITGSPILDAYELDGTHLWRIDLGINIREGEHYTQFMVYDLDGDGRAELACKTADGTIDGRGKVIGEPGKDWRCYDEDSRRHGRILEGPEYFTIFDGRTGAALKTVDYIPSRDPIDGWGGIGGNGGNDDYGNRCDRFLACVAYLDGERPSVVMCRGVYGRIVMAAWDWREHELSLRWVFDSGTSYPPYEDASPFSGMGGHSLSVADVDADGKDEIVYHAMTIDDDGTGLYSTGRRHGDAMHVSDFYPDRPGQELFLITENEDHTVRFQTPGVGMHDARTGEILWSHSPGIDVGSGLVADIDPRHAGCEAWGGPGDLRDVQGKEIGPRPRSSDWAIWWDGDLLRELFSRSSFTKWNWEEGREETLRTVETSQRVRRPALVGDLIGDWREELLVASPDGQSLRLYTTTIPTPHRLYTLMHDPQYRLAIAWQNVVYNKPPHPSFFLGHGMKTPPRPSIRPVEAAGEGSVDDQQVLRGRGKREVLLHDPSTIVACDGEYWMFSTGRGIRSWRSRDMNEWEQGPRVFESMPSWVKEVVPTQRGHFWAPDIVRVEGRYHLYYSVSSFGKNSSAIALASNTTLNPADPSYRWIDRGIIVQSAPSDDYNAIDPGLIRSGDGRLWMTFGSFWSGIKLVELDVNTGLRIEPRSPLHALAQQEAIEAPAVYAYRGFYYLFVNWGFCCRGVDSTYSIRVGRSRDITGPYYDRAGVNLLDGGGSLLLETDGPFIGPGHAGVLEAGGQCWFSCHFYDGTDSGRSKLSIQPLMWDEADWPGIRTRPPEEIP